MSSMQGAASAFRTISKGKEIPNWEEFDPETMDMSKKHALFMNEVIGSKGMRVHMDTIVPFNECLVVFTDFVNNHPAVEFVVIDEEKNSIILSGVDGLENAVKAQIPTAIAGLIMDGYAMKKALLEVKEAQRGEHKAHWVYESPYQNYV